MKLSEKTKEFIDRCNRIDAKNIDHEFLLSYRRHFRGWSLADFKNHIPEDTRRKIHDKWDLLLKEASETYSDLCLQGKIGIGGLIFPGIGGVFPSTGANYVKMTEKFRDFLKTV